MKLGTKLRHARLARRLRLKDVAFAADCTEGMISKIENGKVDPSLALLHRLVGAIGTNISALFEDTPDQVITRKASRQKLTQSNSTERSEIEMELLTPTPSPVLFQASIHIVPPGVESDGPIEHEGEDFGYLLEGQLELRISDQTYELSQGDAFYFPSTSPHSYSNLGNQTAKVLWFNTPPTF